MNDKETMFQFYKVRSESRDNFGLWMILSLSTIMTIAFTAATINATIQDWVWQVDAFLATCSALIAISPFSYYKMRTHVPRHVRKAEEKRLEREHEIKLLRAREQNLGLDPYEFGKVGK